MSKNIYRAFFLLLVLTTLASAQTGVFTYQGKLFENGSPANANYDFECKLYDASTGGTLLGTRTRLNVSVTGGVFTVTLDFATTLFDGSDRYLEIGVRTAGSAGGYQQLLPRQPLTSAPYAFRSVIATNAINSTTAQNALQLGGVAANQYVIATDSRLSDARNPLPSSGNYIQNTTSQQATSNFSISGNGSIGGTLNSNVVNATSQYNVGGQRVLTTDGFSSLFVGVSAGAANTFGGSNSFLGFGAGAANTIGSSNSFVGRDAGSDNTTGSNNTFIGVIAGVSNTTGSLNTFIGAEAGSDNKTGSYNTFVGFSSGSNNTASENTFIGQYAGAANTSGNSNTFVGKDAGITNTIGLNNTVVGAEADVSGNLFFATAIGAGAVVSDNNSIVLGRATGADAVRIPGAVLIDGSLVVHTLGSAGSTPICLNSADRLAPCSSSLRYKSNVQSFFGGLDIVKRLRPITFDWKEGGVPDVGFGAEEVFAIEPRLIVRNKQGEIEGVKYGELTTVLVNAVKELETQIEAQQKEIVALKKLVCLDHPEAGQCRP